MKLDLKPEYGYVVGTIAASYFVYVYLVLDKLLVGPCLNM